MISDHSAANTELQRIAKQANIALPSQLTGKDAAEGQKLRGAFDQAYARVSCAIIRRLWSYSKRRRVRARIRP
jgi:predicted outer membrane protein